MTAGDAGPTGAAAPTPPADAAQVFGPALADLERYAALLAGAGIERGLIGPREVPRLWDRHLVNSAAVTALIPENATVVDVGSGAGLPGLVVAIVRADLQVVLVDATARRTTFLTEAVGLLGLTERVRVVTGRVEDAPVRADIGTADVVLSRAVAALPQLVRWCLPLVSDTGTVLAVKGSRARDEVAAGREEIRRAGAVVTEVHDLEFGGQTTTVVALQRREPRRRPSRPHVSRGTTQRGPERTQ